mmetsp:Transcript_17014/g.38303  ORF Transcript_17014/g.38303 Transcript_17014/m.38303 type:complete len:104 (-) Transcript_17014:1559-1870(-)
MKRDDDDGCTDPRKPYCWPFCCLRSNSRFDSINDSIRVGLRRARRQSGGTTENTFVPRAPFPFPKEEFPTEVNITSTLPIGDRAVMGTSYATTQNVIEASEED